MIVITIAEVGFDGAIVVDKLNGQHCQQIYYGRDAEVAAAKAMQATSGCRRYKIMGMPSVIRHIPKTKRTR